MALASVERLWVVAGTVIDETTREPGVGFEVYLFDHDDTHQETSLAMAETDAEGRFQLDFALKDFEKAWTQITNQPTETTEEKPDLFFRVYYGNDLVADLAGEVLVDFSDHRLDVQLTVPFPDEARLRGGIEQDVYLKIEKVYDYSPVNPEENGDYKYLRDCFRRPGHEDGTIGRDEADLKKFTALVYRQYSDATHTTPVSDKLIEADLSEPSVERRIPTVIYTRPGRRLRIHVHNGDDAPHSLHMHGLQYGIDSDGAFPLGIANSQGVRSDAICPGESYTYTYDVKPEMVGCWVFHDHYRDLGTMARLGLIGGLVVRDPSWPKVQHEVPLFMHSMAGRRAAPLFDSGDVAADAQWSRRFAVAGTFHYSCFYHGHMHGSIVVEAGGADSATVTISDNAYEPAKLTVAPGATVTWINQGDSTHTVTESGATKSATSMTINGRSHAGNTPVIEVHSGQKIRWYVFNHDFGQGWHNFHAHASHWSFGGQNLDNQSIGPAESFVVHTTAPPVVLPPVKDEHKVGQESGYQLASLHPVHCHVEAHVMAGMVCLLRVKQFVILHESYFKSLEFPLPEDPGTFECPPLPPDLCVDESDDGTWETLPEAPVFAVHAALLKTGKVLFWSGHAEIDHQYGTQAALYDPANTTDPYSTVDFADDDDLFCSGHTFLKDGRLITGGGANQGQVDSTHVFDPDTEKWSLVVGGTMKEKRWYPTLVALPDGRTAVVSGTPGGGGTVSDLEVIDMSETHPSWQVVTGGSKTFSGLYPGIHGLPSGDLFFSRTGWNSHGTDKDAARFRFDEAPANSPPSTSGPSLSGTWTDFAPLSYPDRREGSSVLLIDDKRNGPTAKVFVAGGQTSQEAAIKHCEIIDVTDPDTAAWTETSPMTHARIGVTSVVLPDGRILVVGGRQTTGRFDPTPKFVLPCEIYDPATDRWQVTPPMSYPRQYHSTALLLPDGRVFASGGVDRRLGHGAAGNQQSAEVYSPAYLSVGPRPTHDWTKKLVSYHTSQNITTEKTSDVDSVCLIAPCAVSHHTDSHQRYIKLRYGAISGTEMVFHTPSSQDVAPPGYYLFFLVNKAGVPSLGHWVQIG